MRDPVFTVQSLDNCLAMIHSLHMKPDENHWTRPDMELWEDVIQEIEEHSEDCVEFSGFDTNESKD
jgi:dipeptidyl aminopeptidase/acylaminoacyl peptidase